MATRIVFATLLSLCSFLAQGQISSDVKDIQQARQRLIIGTDATKYLSSILQTISGAATHNQSPTALAVYNYCQNFLSGVTTTTRLTGAGTSASPLDIAQQGATQGQVLRWSGAAWVPNGTNLYDIATTSGSIAAHLNQVWVATLTASITLNLPSCNAANDGLKIEISKTGADDFGVVIEPAGSETFIDGATSKTLYSRGTGLSCTCRFRLGDGQWYFINL